MYKPRMIAPVKQGVHLEYRWSGGYDPHVVRIEQLR